ncbi:hypothetical protein HMPREF9374_3120 [Desmospora sp. 8437]|nr:hypothetical protein HMPREF9374_3120 [Desmospora sp. 8437]
MEDWSFFFLWEWQAMSVILVMSSSLALVTKRRLFRAVAWGSVASLVLAFAILDSSGPVLTVAGIILGAICLLLMSKQILEPEGVDL